MIVWADARCVLCYSQHSKAQDARVRDAGFQVPIFSGFATAWLESSCADRDLGVEALNKVRMMDAFVTSQ